MFLFTLSGGLHPLLPSTGPRSSVKSKHQGHSSESSSVFFLPPEATLPCRPQPCLEQQLPLPPLPSPPAAATLSSTAGAPHLNPISSLASSGYQEHWCSPHHPPGPFRALHPQPGLTPQPHCFPHRPFPSSPSPTATPPRMHRQSPRQQSLVEN